MTWRSRTPVSALRETHKCLPAFIRVLERLENPVKSPILMHIRFWVSSPVY